jgi:NitT/TauT family transport system substrate-binding protein
MNATKMTHRWISSLSLRLSAFVLLCLMLAGCARPESEPDLIRVGVLQYGTVNWELSVVQSQGFAEARGVNIEIVPLASDNALAVALQGDRVDLIVSDWLWAARQRSLGRDYQFAPYSLAVGALMVNPESGIGSLAEMEGEELGIAGGPVDKMWILMRAYAAHMSGRSLADMVEPTFAAPPLLNELMLSGDVPLAINFWHYNARLEAAGMQPLFTLRELVTELGVDRASPLLGWIFRQQWAAENTETLTAFLQASYEAKAALRDSDALWEELRDQIKPETEAVMEAIVRGYREGIPTSFGSQDIAAAQELFAILAAEGGPELVGDLESLPESVFWQGFRLP